MLVASIATVAVLGAGALTVKAMDQRTPGGTAAATGPASTPEPSATPSPAPPLDGKAGTPSASASGAVDGSGCAASAALHGEQVDGCAVLGE
ncbi:hypothetical protein P3T27_005581 [Kitasatospora sp. MAA19]|nr:hypothetical protein [Kitasatospora sp. MAA19]